MLPHAMDAALYRSKKGRGYQRYQSLKPIDQWRHRLCAPPTFADADADERARGLVDSVEFL